MCRARSRCTIPATSTPSTICGSRPGWDTTCRRFRARLPDAPVDSWRLLYDPAVVSKLKDCGVTVLDEPTEVVGTALIYLGKNPNSESPDDLAAAMKVLMAIRPYVRYVNSSRYIDDLANGEICLALGWSGDVKQARGPGAAGGQGLHHHLLASQGRRGA